MNKRLVPILFYLLSQGIFTGSFLPLPLGSSPLGSSLNREGEYNTQFAVLRNRREREPTNAGLGLWGVHMKNIPKFRSLFS